MMDVRVQQQLLPGIGHRYEVLLDQRRLVIVVQRNGRRELAIVQGTDEHRATVALSQDEAVAVAAILTGARFSIDTSADANVGDVDVHTVTIGPGSPALGHTAPEVPLPAGVDAEVLAVIRDETPELVEDEAVATIGLADRLVIAVRRDQAELVLHHLTGEPERT